MCSMFNVKVFNLKYFTVVYNFAIFNRAPFFGDCATSPTFSFDYLFKMATKF
uniref:Uncharacterized protein n=1 Tax=Anguilla anguilla TaxID=7936 RepID=A0A0E9VYD0_ANGAN